MGTSDWPEISYFEEGTDAANNILSQLELLEEGDWLRLYRAADGTYWRIDAWDKYQTQFLVRLSVRDGWQEFDATQLQKDLLKKTRGESSSNVCRWADCSNAALCDSEFCVDHFWDAGHRR